MAATNLFWTGGLSLNYSFIDFFYWPAVQRKDLFFNYYYPSPLARPGGIFFGSFVRQKKLPAKTTGDAKFS